MMKKPVSALNNRRPVTQYAKMAAAMGGNPRYKVRVVQETRIVPVSRPYDDCTFHVLYADNK